MTSASAVTLNDFKRVFGAPANFTVIDDDCLGAPPDVLRNDLSAIDESLRSLGQSAVAENKFWVDSIAQPDETWFSFVSTDSNFTAKVGADANFSITPAARIQVEQSLGTQSLELVFATVRRRVDIGAQGMACLKNASSRACEKLKGGRVSYVRSVLYGTLIRAGSKKLKVGGTQEVVVGKPFEFSVKEQFTTEDITGGWIGRLNGEPLTKKGDVTTRVGVDLPEMIGLVREKRFFELSGALNKMTERYGAVGVELATIDCPK